MKNFSATIALLAIGSSVAAQAATELDTQVVTASRSQARIEQMPLHTTILSRDDIEKSAAQTLDALLRDIPGFQFSGIPATQSDPTGHQTKMRGLGNAKVLVLLDGIPLHDPFYSTTQWFKVPLSNIERVEIIRGGNSSLWGNMAVSGVVNIVSKKGFNNNGEASVGVGSRGSSNLSLSKNFSDSDVIGYNITVDQLTSNGWNTTPKEHQWRYPLKSTTDTKNTNFQFTTFFKPSTDLSGYVRLGHHTQDQLINYSNGVNVQKSPDVSASVIKKFDEKSNLTTSAWAQNLDFNKNNGQACYWSSGACKLPDSVTLPQANNATSVVQFLTQPGVLTYKERGASTVYSTNLNGAWRSLQLGADYRQLSAVDNETVYKATVTTLNAPNAATDIQSRIYGKGTQTFTGLFAQTKVQPTDALELTLSLRQDNWKNTDQISQMTKVSNGVNGQILGGAMPDGSKSALNPSISGRYSVNDDLALRSAMYRSFRAPGFNNTIRSYGSPNPTIANPDLSPETLLGREIGLDYNKDNLTVGATYFDYDIKDMIATYTITGAAQFAVAPNLVQSTCGSDGALCSAGGGASPKAKFYTNDQDGKAKGLELTGRWKASTTLSFNGFYTYTKTYLSRVGSVVTDPTNVQLAGVPKEVFGLGVSWKPQPKIQTHLQARYVGSMYYDTTTVGAPNRKFFKQAGFAVYDLSGAYAWDKQTDIVASVQNLFNKTYSENAYDYSKPWTAAISMPRTVNVGMRVRF
jgi:outer membrane cobalamin receptor